MPNNMGRQSTYGGSSPRQCPPLIPFQLHQTVQRDIKCFGRDLVTTCVPAELSPIEPIEELIEELAAHEVNPVQSSLRFADRSRQAEGFETMLGYDRVREFECFVRQLPVLPHGNC